MRSRIIEMLVVASFVATGGCLVEEAEPEGRFDKKDDGDGGSGLETPATSGVGGGAVSGSGSSTASTGSGAGTTGSGGNGGCSYEPANGCLDADLIEQMAGDDGSDQRVIKGTKGQFVKVFVAETVSSWVSFPELALTARLDNSPGMDFDLVVYDGGAMPSCDGDSYELTESGNYLTASWGDDKNNDDGRWWVFEVQHASGSQCGSAAEWTLTLASNFAPECATDGACTTDDDCVCGDCAADAFCSDPANCADDGVCDPYSEGCGCGDCASTPACF